MSMEENFSSPRIDKVELEGVQQQDVELTEFKKHAKLVSELRHHILSYNDGPTRINYSQCSKVSNTEVHRFNTEPPMHLDIIENSDGVVVKMLFVKNIERGWLKSVEKNIDKKFVFSENMTDEMQKYLMKFYKYVGLKRTFHLRINVKQWPTDVMKMQFIKNIEELHVIFYNSMCNDFIEYFKSIDLVGKDVHFYGRVEEADGVVVPAEIFKATGFPDLQAVTFYQKCEIDGEDFINLQNDWVSLISSVSFDDIRAKVHKWNSESQSKDTYIEIELPKDDDRVLDLFTIFPIDEFDILPMQHGRIEKFQIGKVIVYAEEEDDYEEGKKKTLSMEFNKD